MKEIYRSFDMLGVECREGYILYSLKGGELIQYEDVSVYTDANHTPVRFPAKRLPSEDYQNRDKLYDLVAGCYDGLTPGGQVYFHGKWYKDTTIDKIRAKHQDNNWRRFVK